jgi:hypothetical protein
LIISHKYKFIFIKTNKTAGTSIEIALSKFCGDDDVITKIEREDELIRSGLGYRGPQNHFIKKSDFNAGQWYRYLFKGKKPKYHKHISAQKAKGYFGDEIWNSYYKFCVERNPWDRLISYYFWRNKSEPRPSISEFLESETPLRLQSRGIDLYTIDGKVAVDKICLYEDLTEELEQVRLKCNLPERIILPNAKGSHRKDRRDYREILNQEQVEKIRELFKREIALLGFEY